MTADMQYVIVPFDPLGGSGHLIQQRDFDAVQARLKWQVADAVADQVSSPIRYVAPFSDESGLRDLHRFSDTLIVSDKFRICAEPWLKDFEFVPAEIELSTPLPPEEYVSESPQMSVDNGGGGVVGGYWWLNTWRRLDLVDWDKSQFTPTRAPRGADYETSPVRARGWKNLALTRPVPDDEHLFGWYGFLPPNIFVSNLLRSEVLRCGLRVAFGVRMFNSSDGYLAPSIMMKLNELRR